MRKSAVDKLFELIVSQRQRRTLKQIRCYCSFHGWGQSLGNALLIWTDHEVLFYILLSCLFVYTSCLFVDVLQHLVGPRHPHCRFPMSTLHSASHLHDFLEERISLLQRRYQTPGQRHRGGILRHQLFFVDDLHVATPLTTKSTSQPGGVQFSDCSPLELLRQLMATSLMYGRQRHFLIPMREAHFIAAVQSGKKGAQGSSFLCPRLLRHFTHLAMLPLSETGLESALYNRLFEWLSGFPPKAIGNCTAITKVGSKFKDHLFHRKFIKQHSVCLVASVISLDQSWDKSVLSSFFSSSMQSLVSATIQVYYKMASNMSPRPCYPYLVFNQKHVFQVIDGMLLFSAGSKPRHFGHGLRQPGTLNFRAGTMAAEAAKPRRRGFPGRTIGAIDETGPMQPPMLRVLARLWCHETARTYGDGITNNDQIAWFNALLVQALQKSFCGGEPEESQSSGMPHARINSQRAASRRQSGRTTPGGGGRRATSRQNKGRQRRSGKRFLDSGAPQAAKNTTSDEDTAEIEYTLSEGAEGLVVVPTDSLMRRGQLVFLSGVVTWAAVISWRKNETAQHEWSPWDNHFIGSCWVGIVVHRRTLDDCFMHGNCSKNCFVVDLLSSLMIGWCMTIIASPTNTHDARWCHHYNVMLYHYIITSVHHSINPVA